MRGDVLLDVAALGESTLEDLFNLVVVVEEIGSTELPERFNLGDCSRLEDLLSFGAADSATLPDLLSLEWSEADDLLSFVEGVGSVRFPDLVSFVGGESSV